MTCRLAARRALLRAVALTPAAASLRAARAAADDFPNRPIRIVVPFAPGGGGDAVVRNISERLSEQLGANVLLDNRPGASGYIGAQIVAGAPADGYTLLMAFDGSVVVAPNLIKAPFDPIADFAPVTKLCDATLVIATHPSVPARTVRELVELSKSRPGGLQFGSSGAGTTTHLAGELLAIRTAMKVQHVPYRGGGQAVTDVVSGQIPMIITVVPTIAGFLHDGRLNAIAVMSRQRAEILPAVPTVMESGVADFEVYSWYGILAPAKTPGPIVARLQHDIAVVLAMPQTKERYVKGGFEPIGNASDEFGRQLKADLARWSKVVAEADIKLKVD